MWAVATMKSSCWRRNAGCQVRHGERTALRDRRWYRLPQLGGTTALGSAHEPALHAGAIAQQLELLGQESGQDARIVRDLLVRD